MIDLNEKDMKDLMESAKNYEPSDEEIMIIGNLAEEYKDKSEEDMFVEIIRVNNEMEEKMTSEEYEAIFKKLDAMRPMLSDDQNQKLDKILELLNQDK